MKKIDCWVETRGGTKIHIDERGKVDRGVRDGLPVYPYRRVYKKEKDLYGNRVPDGYNSCWLSYDYFRKLWNIGECKFA